MKLKECALANVNLIDYCAKNAPDNEAYLLSAACCAERALEFALRYFYDRYSIAVDVEFTVIDMVQTVSDKGILIPGLEQVMLLANDIVNWDKECVIGMAQAPDWDDIMIIKNATLSILNAMN